MGVGLGGGACAGLQAGGGQWGAAAAPYGCSAGGGAGLGAWGGAGDARGVAAAASDAGGAFEAPPPNPYRKVVWLGLG